MDELEYLARRIAARRMGLVKDMLGRDLPDDIWRQAIPAAEREMAQRRADNEDLDIFRDH